MLDIISIFLNLLRLVLIPNMWSILENIPCALEKNVYSAALGWNVLKTLIKYIWPSMSFKAAVSLLILSERSIHWYQGVLRVPCYDCPISPFMFTNICFRYLGAPMLGTPMLQGLYLLVGLLPLSLCSVLLCLLLCSFCFKVYFVWYKHCYSNFFSFPFAWNTFFHPFTFSLCVPSLLRWVPCRQHLYGFCFLIHSATLCLLIEAFKPFTFKATIDRYVFSAILFFITMFLFSCSFFFKKTL